MYWLELLFATDLLIMLFAQNVQGVPRRVSLAARCSPPEQFGEHALHEAVFAGNLPIIRLLIERGADPNMANDSGVSALMDAAGSGRMDVVRYLLDAGADASLSDVENTTALD